MQGQIDPIAKTEIQYILDSLEIKKPDSEIDTYKGSIDASLDWYSDLNKFSPISGGASTLPDDSNIDPPPATDPHNAFISKFDLESNATGPLDGVDIALKDNIAVAGAPLTCGTRVFESVVPTEHATVVQRLLDAGAAIRGKTNMDEFAYGPTGETSQFGPTKNPRDTNHVSGGSSSGSGAAVASHDVEAAIGSDTGGSVRIPAAFCGLVGVKPSWGIIPRTGFVELAHSLDTIGPLTRNVEMAATLIDTLTGVDEQDPTSERARRITTSFEDSVADPPEMENVSIGLPQEFFDIEIVDEIQQTIDDSIESIEDQGASVTQVSVPSVESTVEISNAIFVSEFAATIQSAGVPYRRNEGIDVGLSDSFISNLLSRGHEIGDIAMRKIIEGMYLNTHYGGRLYTRAMRGARQLRQEFRDTFADIDVLLSPTLPRLAPEIGEWSPDTYGEATPIAVNTRPINIAGLPAVTLPVGSVSGLPVGMQLIGPLYEDPKLIGIAKTCEDIVV